MQVEITNAFTNDGKEYFKWELYDGPDGIEHVHGFATDLITAFSKVMEWREKIANDYAAEALEDLENAKQFIVTQLHNETDH
jgi:hypothetical protein